MTPTTGNRGVSSIDGNYNGRMRLLRSLRAPSLAILLVACSTSGCGTSGGAAADPASGTEVVQLTIEHRSEWRQLWIEGSTDLPDGAFVDFQVTHEMGDTTPAAEWPATNLIESGRATVTEGHFWTRINTFNWPRGSVRIVVQFPVPPQPPEIEARYGSFGERLAGDNVVTVAGAKVVEVEHVFDHRR
jgi:hypothetical protein